MADRKYVRSRKKRGWRHIRSRLEAGQEQAENTFVDLGQVRDRLGAGS